MAESTVAPGASGFDDPNAWVKIIETAGPGFAYFLLALLFLLVVILIVRWPVLAPTLRAFWPWAVRQSDQTQNPTQQPEDTMKGDAWVNAEDAAEVIEATRRHGEMRILSKIADGDRTAVIFVDTSGIIQTFNKAAERLTGYEEGEVMGVNVSILMDGLHSRHHDKYIKGYLEDRDSQRRSRLVGAVRKVELKRKDGEMVRIRIRLTEISNGIRGFWSTMEIDDSPVHHGDGND